MSTIPRIWDVDFLRGGQDGALQPACALIVLNQPFSLALLHRLWSSTRWHCCADGGANRLFDILNPQEREKFLPDLIMGDLDSIRPEVREFYTSSGVDVIQDHDQYSTDLMKCIAALEEKEKLETLPQYRIVLLGGLSGRLDQTIHTLSYLHKLRKKRDGVYAVTDDNVGWVLDTGEHEIQIDHGLLGQTCGLLPVGIDETILSTSGLRWNLTDHPSSFDGLISTSNHLVPEEAIVRIKTSKPIWWTVELKCLSTLAELGSA